MKKYTRKQEYEAFYWDGSNVEALQGWLDGLNLNADISSIPVKVHPQYCWVLFAYNDTDDLVAKHELHKDKPIWIVISIDVTTLVVPQFKFYRQEVLDEYFVEVAG